MTMPFYDYYGDRSATAAGIAWVRTQARYVLGRLLCVSPHSRSLLEIGPGRGVFAGVCRQAHLRYYALDINHRLLMRLGDQGVCRVQSYAERLPFVSRAFDIAFASHVIEHSPGYVEALSLLSEMRRVVIPGGIVALIVPDYLALREDFWNCDYSHSFVTTRRRLLQMYHDAELTVIEQRSLYGPLTGTVGWLGGYTLGGGTMGAIARMIPGALGEKLYKMRLTFARAILMIGRVPQ